MGRREMMTKSSLKKELENIKSRNKRVEADKAWETSWARRILITILTYIVILIFFIMADFPKPFLNAIVPAVAFLLSTLTLALFKKLWINNYFK